MLVGNKEKRGDRFGHLFTVVLSCRQHGAGEVQQQTYQHAQSDAGKGGNHPQAAALGELTGHVQPAQA